MIDRGDNVTEPPFTKKMSLQNITHLYQTGGKPQDMSMKDIPNHIQNVERHVQIISQVALCASTKERREGMIFNKIESRKRRAKFDSKKRFQLNNLI